MANRKRTNRPRRADRHGQTAPTTTGLEPISAMCAVHRHATCRGLIVSLLFPQDQACECLCHRLPVPDAWKPVAA